MSRYHSLKGMTDIFPEEAREFHFIENRAREVFDIFGFGEIRTPFLESTEVFTRSIGEGTDIVEKEMYSLLDRGGKHISLRPEGTASIVRACVENGKISSQDIVKLFYIGPMFRGERPQKGRLRQFTQIGAEIIGGSTPYLDAELIITLRSIFDKLGIEDYNFKINSLGCEKDRDGFKRSLRDFVKDNEVSFCEDCLRRADKNVLRVLDCKKKECRGSIQKMPDVQVSLCEDCKRDYVLVKGLLQEEGVSFTEDPYLVRGLDYYTGIIFEVTHPSLGAQDAVAAGGRYDDLVKQMGGPRTGATGYAIGVERLRLVLEDGKLDENNKGTLAVALDEGSMAVAFKVVNRLRRRGIICEIDHSGRSLKGGLRKANKEGRKKVIIIGEEEVKSGDFMVKDMETGDQSRLSFDDLVRELAD